jgi:hypothetical protein
MEIPCPGKELRWWTTRYFVGPSKGNSMPVTKKLWIMYQKN